VITQTPAVLAFQNEDSTASKEFHKLSDEPHKVNLIKKSFERLLESSLHGAVSGLTTSCIVVAAVSGFTSCGLFGPEKLPQLVVILGMTLLLTQGFSLAFTDFLKRQEYIALYNREKRREKWECDNYIEGEQKEMVELYTERGLSRTDAEAVIKILSKDKSFFVEVMMKEELEMIKPDEAITPLKNGATLFLCMVVSGVLPLLPYLAQCYSYSTELGLQTSHYIPFVISFFIALVALFAAGVLKSNFTVTTWWISGALLLLNGTAAFGVTYYIASTLPTYFL